MKQRWATGMFLSRMSAIKMQKRKKYIYLSLRRTWTWPETHVAVPRQAKAIIYYLTQGNIKYVLRTLIIKMVRGLVDGRQ
jgi:hypothetical protein